MQYNNTETEEGKLLRKSVSLFIGILLLTCALAVPALGAPLLLYTSQPDEDVQVLLKDFGEHHPGIEVQVFRSGTEEVVSKVLAEKMTGRVQADVLLLADAVTFERLKVEEILEAYRSPEAAEIPASFIDTDGMYCGTKMLATVFVFNTTVGEKPEASWKALTDPKNKDKSIMPSPLYSGAAAYQLGVLTRTEGFGWDFYKQMKENDVAVGQGNGTIITAVAGGEKAFGPVVDYMALRAKAKGSPVDYIYLAEGGPVITEPVGIVAKEGNRDDAKRFVDFVLSEPGQMVVSKLGYVPARNGIPVPEGLLGVGQVRILETDIAVLVREREKDKNSFSEYFGN